MFNIIGEIPKKLIVAFSGGIDSVVVVDFLLNGKKDVELAFFHHGTNASTEAEKFVLDFAFKRGLSVNHGKIIENCDSSKSMEEHWRDSRYAFLQSLQFEPNITVLTAHHLDDAIETWIFSALHGQPKLIPYRRNNVIRPFLTTKKSEIISWAKRRNLSWVQDASNDDISYMRNLIRHRIVPEALKVNPGLHKTIMKKYVELGVDSR